MVKRDTRPVLAIGAVAAVLLGWRAVQWARAPRPQPKRARARPAAEGQGAALGARGRAE
jgi:hypothetical protein